MTHYRSTDEHEAEPIRPWESGIILSSEFDDLEHLDMWDDLTLRSRERVVTLSLEELRDILSAAVAHDELQALEDVLRRVLPDASEGTNQATHQR